jgi:hypothetical protein
MDSLSAKYGKLLAFCKSLPATPTAVREGKAEALMKGSLHTDELIILTSRADSVTTRLASCGIAALVATARRESASKAKV